MTEWLERPHRRLNPLTGEWVIVSPQRTDRPWQGKVEALPANAQIEYDPACYLCPGNKRAGGIRNPLYTSTFVFDNDFPALLPNETDDRLNDHDLIVAEPERGICRVVCFSPRHDLSLPSLDDHALQATVRTWQEQSRSLQELSFIRSIHIFENRGALMGASNPHPHCQIWAVAGIPNEIAKESTAQDAYRTRHSSCLLCDYIRREIGGERVVGENDMFLAVVPFWAVWPFEILVAPKRHSADLSSLDEPHAVALGLILRDVTRCYDALFGVPFPYSMGFHQCPRGGTQESWHVHAHFYPPLLRSATVRKFMVGFELLASPQRDLSPEEATRRLRKVSSI